MNWVEGKLTFENYKNCLQTTQFYNKTTYLQKNEINTDSPKKDHK